MTTNKPAEATAANEGLLTRDDSEIAIVADDARDVWQKPAREVMYTREDYERDKAARGKRDE